MAAAGFNLCGGEVGIGVRVRDWLASVRWLRTTMVRIFDLFILPYDDVQGAEHFGPASVAHLLGASHVVGCSGTPEDLAEMRLVLDVVATDIHCVHTFDLKDGDQRWGQ